MYSTRTLKHATTQVLSGSCLDGMGWKALLLSGEKVWMDCSDLVHTAAACGAEVPITLGAETWEGLGFLALSQSSGAILSEI